MTRLALGPSRSLTRSPRFHSLPHSRHISVCRSTLTSAPLLALTFSPLTAASPLHRRIRRAFARRASPQLFHSLPNIGARFTRPLAAAASPHRSASAHSRGSGLCTRAYVLACVRARALQGACVHASMRARMRACTRMHARVLHARDHVRARMCVTACLPFVLVRAMCVFVRTRARACAEVRS